jgi:hypothetical protein
VSKHNASNGILITVTSVTTKGIAFRLGCYIKDKYKGMHKRLYEHSWSSKNVFLGKWERRRRLTENKGREKRLRFVRMKLMMRNNQNQGSFLYLPNEWWQRHHFMWARECSQLNEKQLPSFLVCYIWHLRDFQIPWSQEEDMTRKEGLLKSFFQ